jgi:NAD(P)-dependent dehydrogenase (short-subunit alcohol dehydrogenase family)
MYMSASSSGRLTGRVALVTGAGRGIGAAVARAFAAEGASVVVSDAGVAVDGSGTDAGPAATVVEEIERAGGIALSDATNVTDYDGCATMIERTVSTYGGLDILVNAAGILRDRMIFNLNEDDWDVVIDVHLKGTYNTTRHAASYWRAHKDEGDYRLVNFTSGSGLFGAPTQPNYAAAKMGIVGLTLWGPLQRRRAGCRNADDDEPTARGLRGRHHVAGKRRAGCRLPRQFGVGLAQRPDHLVGRRKNRAGVEPCDRTRSCPQRRLEQ